MSKSKQSLSSVVKNYLDKTNRPYSANDVFNNLNTKDSKLSKSAVFKALDDLVAKQDIKEKLNGKQKVFFIDQNSLTTTSDQNSIQTLDQQIQQLSQQFNQIRDELKIKESKLSSFRNCLSSQQISHQKNEVNKELTQLQKRLQSIDTKDKNFDPKLNEKVKNERQKLVIEWRKRKRMADNVIETLLEVSSKPKKALIEEIGLETDEELQVSMPSI